MSIAKLKSLAASEAGDILEKSEIVLAYPQPSRVLTPVFVAEETGLFKIHGLNLKLPQLNPKPTSVQAVISGSADMSVAAGDLVNATLQGAPRGRTPRRKRVFAYGLI